MGRACSSLNVSLSLVRLPSFECVTFQTNGCSTHPANLWVLTTDRPGRMLWSSNSAQSSVIHGPALLPDMTMRAGA
jgi:hypothetical protein